MTEQEEKKQKEQIVYWMQSAERDKETALGLRGMKKYDWSLFVYHLAIEKLLKALVIQVGETPPPIHQLNRLAEMAGLDLSERHKEWMVEITDYNIEARYDDEKLSFYHKATKEYANIWHERCDNIFLWLKKNLDR